MLFPSIALFSLSSTCWLPLTQIVPLYVHVLFILDLDSAYERKYAIFMSLAYFA
jgi:hypothetical protein